MTFLLILGYLVIGYGLVRAFLFFAPPPHDLQDPSLLLVVLNLLWPFALLSGLFALVGMGATFAVNRAKAIKWHNISGYVRAVYGVKPQPKPEILSHTTRNSIRYVD